MPYCPYTRPGPAYYNGPDLTKAQALVTESCTRGMPVVVYDKVTAPESRTRIDYFASVLRELGYRVTVQSPALSPASYDYPYDSRNRVQVPGLEGWIADYPGPANFYQPLLSCAAFKPETSDNFNFTEFCDPTIDQWPPSREPGAYRPGRGASRVDRRGPCRHRRSALGAH